MSRTFTTAYEEERSTEVLSSSPSVCSSGLNEPGGFSAVASSSRSTRKAPALAQAPVHLLDELPAPAQELLDEIECLKQQDSIARDSMEEGLCDCRVQKNGLTLLLMTLWKEFSMLCLQMSKFKNSNKKMRKFRAVLLGKHSEGQKFRLWEQQSSASPFRVIVLDQNSSPT